MATHAIVLVGPSTTDNPVIVARLLDNQQPKKPRGQSRLNKDIKNMAPTEATTQTTQPTAKVTRTVFDLQAFDDVKLSKTVTLPSKPTTLEEALSACGNDSAKLLEVIHEGLVAETKSRAYDEIDGFNVVDAEGVETPYTGRFADEEKGELINKAILAIAKMNGYAKDLAPEKKRALKEKATAFLRENPAMLSSIQG